MTTQIGDVLDLLPNPAVGLFLFFSSFMHFACGPPEPIEIAATSIAVDDMLQVVPQEVASEPGRFVTGFWNGRKSRGRVPEAVILRAGLPVIEDSIVVGNDSTVVILNLFPPLIFPGDSVEVYTEWIVIPPHSGRFWGHAYNYYFRCKRRCRLLGRSGPGHLN
jgi:hypothetical protein